jgi:cytochrome P450
MRNTLDLSEPGFLRNRRESYRLLRRTNPVAVTELNGEKTVVLTRYQDVDAVLRNRRAMMQPAVGEFPPYIGSGPASVFYRLSLPSVDAPDHTRLRRIVSPAFTPQAVSRLEQWVAQIIERRIAEVDDQGVIDVVEQLSDTIPIDVACGLFHIPRQDVPALVNRVNDIIAVLSQADMSAAELARADDATRVFFDYFRNLLRDIRGSLPEHDFVATLSSAEAQGQLSPEEVDTVLVDTFLGSYHTTMVSCTNAIHALAAHPAQRAALIADPTLAARAWEELLRFDSPVHFRHRYLSEPMMINDCLIEPRVKIMLGLASANWDETVFENPDSFDLSRPTNRHLAFGGGGHFCLGSQLSRLEGKLFLPRFLARFPDFRLADPLPPRSHNLTFPYIESLRIELLRRH